MDPTSPSITLAAATALVVATTKILQPVAKKGAELIDTLLGEPCKVAGGMLGDQMYAWQISNRLKIAAKTKEKLDMAGVDAKAVAPDFLLPYLEATGNCSDEELQEIWATLLASAATDSSHAHPAFIGAIKSLRRPEAETFRGLVQAPVAFPWADGKLTASGKLFLDVCLLRAVGLADVQYERGRVLYSISVFGIQLAKALKMRPDRIGAPAVVVTET